MYTSAGSAAETYKNKKILEYKQILSEIKNSQDEVQIKSASFISKEEKLSELLNAYENSRNQQHYTAISQADDLLDSLKETNNIDKLELKTYALSYRLSEESVDENGENITIKTNIVRKISEILDDMEKLKDEVRVLSNQIKQTKQQIKDGTIRAEKNGVANVIFNLVEGDLNPVGTTVATIIPAGENKFKAQLYANNADIADIEKGDVVRYNLFAMPSNKYSSASGEVKKISSDSILQDGEHSGFYLIEATINESELTDNDGNRSEIAIGMQTEAKIIIKKKRIITYLLEKMDIFW